MRKYRIIELNNYEGYSNFYIQYKFLYWWLYKKKWSFICPYIQPHPSKMIAQDQINKLTFRSKQTIHHVD